MSKKYAYLRFLFTFLFLIVFPDCLAGNLQKISLNTVGIPPLNERNMSGFMDKVVLEAFNRMGIALETVSLPAERGLISANMGIEDGEMSRIAGLQEKYINLIAVPEKIMDWEFVAISHNTLETKMGWKALEGKHVAIINGWKILEKHVPATANLLKVRNASELFSLFVLKRTDVIIYEKWGGLHQLKSRGLPASLLRSPPLVSREMFIYLNKKHSNLVQRLADSIRSIRKDGSYSLYEKQILSPLLN